MRIEIAEARYGDVILFRSSSLFGRLIRLVDGGEYSHGAIYLEERHGRHLFVEALTDGGVVLSVLDEHAGNFDVFRAPEPYQKKPALLALVNRRKYDFLKIVRILAFYLFARPLPRDDQQKFICTELVNWVHGFALADELATPRTIHERLR